MLLMRGAVIARRLMWCGEPFWLVWCRIGKDAIDAWPWIVVSVVECQSSLIELSLDVVRLMFICFISAFIDFDRIRQSRFEISCSRDVAPLKWFLKLSEPHVSHGHQFVAVKHLTNLCFIPKSPKTTRRPFSHVQNPESSAWYTLVFRSDYILIPF
jgi:hypothetical protein